MEQYKNLLGAMLEFHMSDYVFELYKTNFDDIVKDVAPEAIYSSIQEMPHHLFYLAPLYTGALFTHKRFEEINDFLINIDMTGSDRANDFFNSKLIKHYYLALKYTNRSIDGLYRLMACNGEYGNDCSVLVIKNAILDYQINSGVYTNSFEMLPETAAGDAAERAKNAFYIGFIALVRGDYREALDAFNRADILNKSKPFETKLRKHIIVARLLLGDYSIHYPYADDLRPYFSLIGAVKRAELENFSTVLVEFIGEFMKLNLYFVVRRLLHNVLQEGLRKIAVSYTRIPVTDISTILGVDVDYLLHHAIKTRFIRGYVANGVYYSTHQNGQRVCFGERIQEIIGVRNMIMGMMTYPEIRPLTYELMVADDENASSN